MGQLVPLQGGAQVRVVMETEDGRVIDRIPVGLAIFTS
jgi:hypothetical protein